MEQKTRVDAENGKQELLITRQFDLPVAALFRAFSEPEIVEQWMGTKVLALECKKHGSYQFETSDPKGNVVFRANGTIHEYVPNERITRTFEMENTPFPVQLEFLEFSAAGGEASSLQMKIVFKTVDDRDRLLKMPFAKGINFAHDRLQSVMEKLK